MEEAIFDRRRLAVRSDRWNTSARSLVMVVAQPVSPAATRRPVQMRHRDKLDDGGYGDNRPRSIVTFREIKRPGTRPADSPECLDRSIVRAVPGAKTWASLIEEGSIPPPWP
jgi:hypothetical protein